MHGPSTHICGTACLMLRAGPQKGQRSSTAAHAHMNACRLDTHPQAPPTHALLHAHLGRARRALVDEHYQRRGGVDRVAVCRVDVAHALAVCDEHEVAPVDEHARHVDALRGVGGGCVGGGRGAGGQRGGCGVAGAACVGRVSMRVSLRACVCLPPNEAAHPPMHAHPRTRGGTQPPSPAGNRPPPLLRMSSTSPATPCLPRSYSACCAAAVVLLLNVASLTYPNLPAGGAPGCVRACAVREAQEARGRGTGGGETRDTQVQEAGGVWMVHVRRNRCVAGTFLGGLTCHHHHHQLVGRGSLDLPPHSPINQSTPCQPASQPTNLAAVLRARRWSRLRV